MTAEAILALITAGAQALPSLLALFQKASSGTAVTPAEVAAALSGYETARAGLVAAIAAAETPSAGGTA
jgi:hypothetical protein